MGVDDSIDRYSKYFKNRGMTVNAYERRKLPKYQIDEFPSDLNARILDIGCGLGQTLEALRELGYASIHGIDISEESIVVSEQKGLQVRRLSITSDIEQIARDGGYDFIIMSHVLEHIPKSEIIPTLRQLRVQLLNSKGRLFVAVPNAQSNTGAYWAFEDFTHSTLFTAGSLLYVLKSAGFKDVKFLNSDGTADCGIVKKWIKKMLLGIYDMNVQFWNSVTSSSFHAPSPRIYTYELQAIAGCD